jgi:hypothetical protein
MSFSITAQEKSPNEQKLEETVRLLEECIKRLEKLLLNNPARLNKVSKTQDNLAKTKFESEKNRNMTLPPRFPYLLGTENHSRDLLHIDAAYNDKYDGDEIEVKGKNSYDIRNNLIRNCAFNVDKSQLFGLEGPWVRAAFSSLKEDLYNNRDCNTFHVYYVEASYFLKDEYRSYGESNFQRIALE